MASENKNENVLLTGQTGYFKKNGSMVNFGVLDEDTQDTYSDYGPGFIDEGSIIKGATLLKSDDYKNTESAMKTFLGDFFDDETEGYKVRNTGNKIKDTLAPYYTEFQSYANRIGLYKELPFLTTTDGVLTFGETIQLPKNFTIQLDIEPDYTEESEYNIFHSENNEIRFWKDENNKLCLNDTILNIDGELNTEDTIVIDQYEGSVNVYINGNLINRNIETDIVSNISVTMFEDFKGIIYSFKVFDLDLEKIVLDLKPMIKKNVGGGLMDVITNTFYELTDGTAKLYDEYLRAYMYYNTVIDTGILVNKDTGIEIDFYSSSTTNQLRIFGVESNYSVANTVTFSLYRNSSGQWSYARNNNVGNWISTGVSANTSRTTCSINKQNNGKIIMSGGATVNADLSGTVSNQNTNRQTLWINGSNDLGAFRPANDTTTAFYATGSYYLNVYNIKIWDDQELVRDMIPAVDLATGKNCLYDKVNNEPYFPARGTMYVYNS